jgi:tetratricopeptide (TPR) repeat protein
VGGILHQGFQIAADRYTYLACLGWALVAGAGVILGLQWLSRSRAGITVLGSASVLLLLALSYLCRKQIAVWHDSSALWSRALEVESSYPAHLNLGNAFMDEGDSLGAMQQFREAVALWPDNPLAHSNLGKALLQLNQVDEAIREFQFSLRFDPNPATFNSLGQALAIRGRWDEALAAVREAVRRNPTRKDYRENLKQLEQSQARQ